MNEVTHPLTGEVVSTEDIDEVIALWKEVKDQITTLYNVKNELEQAIVFYSPKPEDSNTAHLESSTGHVKVEYRTRETWNKKQLQAAARLLPDLVDNLKISGVYKRYLDKLERTAFTEPEKQQAKEIIMNAKSEDMAKPYITLEETDE